MRGVCSRRARLAFHLQQTYHFVYTLQGVPNGTGSFSTWLYSGPLGTSPWQGSCDWEAADIVHECSPWRSRTLPSRRALASTWCTYEANPGDMGHCPLKGRDAGREDSYGCCRFLFLAKSRLSLWTGSAPSWEVGLKVIVEELVPDLSIWACTHPDVCLAAQM